MLPIVKLAEAKSQTVNSAMLTPLHALLATMVLLSLDVVAAYSDTKNLTVIPASVDIIKMESIV